ncbi:hypothetical protein ABZ883_14910 [Streptomyces sp. NPDC046977]|uniref:hypothetical protein n=1 Tax=Streptomyces sp. NPDC046977 TaxID=3154703 RepID=UPI003404D4A9
MGRLPRRFMRREVTVEPYLGDGSHGPLYGPPTTVRCFLEERTRRVRDAEGREVTSSSTVYSDLAANCPPESRVTLPGGRQTTVIAALRHDGGGLPTPDHLEVQLQ